MFDLWAFLLQTLTASGVAVLLLVVKAMFQDKLPPRWQFGIWAVLGIAMLIPAGIGGRYVLFNWPLVVDLLKGMTGDYSFTTVAFPFPVVCRVPQGWTEWVFAGYAAGVLIHLVRYGAAYLSLRRTIRSGADVSDEMAGLIRNTAIRYGLKSCNAVVVKGLPSAFVCGVLRPVLVVPEGQTDEKVILHELIHLKNRDTLWSVVICCFRSLHWCNPLIVSCAQKALNDLETRCDQMVLEKLEGEERRDYGRILLSMANDRYAKTPGATCVNNGGKAIRQRIESIARFRLYPAGMGLVSLCAGIILLLPVVVGVQAESLYETGSITPIDLASARTTYCTTPAGAFDSYAKAILTGKDTLRVMCAPEQMQEELAERFGDWEPELPEDPVISGGYYIYNLTRNDDGYEGLLVVQLSYPPEEQGLLAGIQHLRAVKENGRWVTWELGQMEAVKIPNSTALNWNCWELPAFRYSGVYGDLVIEKRIQTVYDVDNWVYSNGFFGSEKGMDLTPKPGARFGQVAISDHMTITHLGTQQQRDEITHIGLGMEPVMAGEEPPERASSYQAQGGSSVAPDGTNWSNRSLEPGWGPELILYGGGSKYMPEEYPEEIPEYYLTDLHINHEYITSLHLTLEEGGPK